MYVCYYNGVYWDTTEWDYMLYYAHAYDVSEHHLNDDGVISSWAVPNTLK